MVVPILSAMAVPIFQHNSCTHFKTIRFKAIAKVKPGKSACHDNENYLELEWDSFPALSGAIVNRTHGTHKNLNIYLFLLTKFGPIYSGPP